jgi:hypothetical protein
LVVVDGKATQRQSTRQNLTFSPDGEHYAYTFGLTAVTLAVDDVVEKGSSVIPMGDGTHDGVSFLFSPDGKHIVHYGSRTSDQQMGFFIDGKFVAGRRAMRPGNPTFTLDARHILWFETVLNAEGRPRGFAVYVDGRPAYEVEDPIDEHTNLWTKMRGTWEMGADGVLTLLAREADGMKRIRITPPADTSIDSFLSTAVPIKDTSVSPD